MNITKRNQIIIAVLVLLVVAGAGGSTLYTNRFASGLDNFITLTNEDPLFYSPFFESEAFNKAVGELKISEEKLKKTALHNISLSKENYVETYTKLIQETPLFPTRFLALLPEISSNTEEFKRKPTAIKARQLLSLYKEAQNAYEQDAKSMTKAYATINNHIPNNRPVYYFFINSATSVLLAQQNFDLIYKNSLVLKQEIDRRNNCLNGKGSCEIENKQNQDDLSSEEIIKLATPTTPTGNNTDLIRNTLPFASTTREVRGPYNIKSPCWGDTVAQPMYAIYSKNKKGEKTILPKLAQENYYSIVAPKATDVISTKIRELGLTFYGQAEGTTYECSDLNFYPDILTLDFIHSQQKSDYTQLWNNKFGLLAPALQSLADFTNLLETSQRISTDFVLSPQFLFSTRSAYSLTYLPFAKSVWRLDQTPKFLLSKEEFNALGAPQQFKTLTELKREGFTETEIKKAQINQKEFIESLTKQQNQ